MVDRIKLKKIFKVMKETIEKNALYLSELDRVAGDGDHGSNMLKGFSAVVNKTENLSDEDLGSILKEVAMTILSKVNGISGVLYGTAFLKASMVAKEKTYIDIKDFIKILEEALKGIMEKGKVKIGEKTMIDCLAPAVRKGKKIKDEGGDAIEVLAAIEEAAEVGMRNTKNMIATKGRASYLGNKSIGYQDAGATSMYMLLKSIRIALEEE